MTELQEQILALFEDPYVPPKAPAQLVEELHRRKAPPQLEEALTDLLEGGYLLCQGNRYFHPRLMNQVAGTFWDSGKGYGFVTPDGASGRGEDVFLPPHSSKGAWHGDRVMVALDPSDGGTERIIGRVIQVLRRNTTQVVGKVIRVGNRFYVEPSGGKLPALQVVGDPSKVRKNALVQATVVAYGSRKGSPLCHIQQVLGKSGTRQAAVEGILCQHHIDRQFPEEVLFAAAHAPRQVYPSTRKNRLDLRDQCIITIDGPYAKDLDDAVSLERLPDGYRLGVHIADVSHYVKENTSLDQEALKRGTSVYFADQVIPMLPVDLSNGICSLNPRVERLTISCIMEMDRQGQVRDYQIAKSVIKTVERMTYPDCNALLAETEPALEERYAHILPMLREMAQLSHKLARLRRHRGALDLATQEASIRCDEWGKPVAVVRRPVGESEQIIESFMLAANETVARYLAEHHYPGVFRVHEKPNSDKLTRLRGLLAPFGFQLETPDAFGMQKLLKDAAGTPEEGAVSMALLRSLMKAKYAPQNEGHFGLGAAYYCHFTSPIRRYPDLMVHRVLSSLLSDRCGPAKLEKLRRATVTAAQQSTDRESAAETAEREIEKCYLAEYMQGHIGESFSGIVSGVTRFGLFVMLPDGVEGLVGLETLPGLWDYDEEKMTLTCGKQQFTFAQSVEVTCVAADPGEGTVTFQLTGVALPKPEERGRIYRQETEEKRQRERRYRTAGKGKKNQRRAMHIPKGRRGHRKGC